MKKNSFRDLDAYREGKRVIIEVYRLLKKFPNEEKYALCDQLRRASISITSNIAEGSGRSSAKDKAHFLEISYGSLMEVVSQMDIACDLGYITPEEFSEFESKCANCARLISGLRQYFKNQI